MAKDMRTSEIDGGRESPDESYFMRLLVPSAERVTAGAVRAELKRARLAIKLAVEAGTDNEWEQLTLEHRQGEMISMIQRIPVLPGSDGAALLESYSRGLPGVKPLGGAKWVQAFLAKVKVIYSFEILDGTDHDRGWDGLYILQGMLQKQLGGIFQSDGEGFSNEEGHHVTWQFDDDVAGPWNMAVLQGGRWESFQMELENRGQRRAFQEGRIPPNTRPVR